MAEVVILEQFTQILPGDGKEWGQWHQPMTLTEAIELMEDSLAADGSQL